MSEMEAVNSFYSELQSLYDVKPPISKGKMTSITRAALKAVKLYKHVVQSVEKFIQKCKTEYKIPGLYVIDSIIRQSRHQFGSEKDVFAPRFSRNIQNTFVHLYRCPEEDKAKIIRVLNLWQKNRIFSPEVIQPLFDLADPQNPIWEQINSQNCNSDSGVNNFNNATGGGMGSSNPTSGTNNSQLGFPLPNVHFNKKLLDFDYGDGDEDGGVNNSGAKNSSDPTNSTNNPNNASGGHLDALGSILSNPEILRQLQTLQEQMAAAVAHSSSSFANTPEQERQRKLAELSKQEAAFDQRLAETVARLPFAKDCELPLPPDGDSRGEPAVDQNSNQLAGGGGNGPNSNVLLPPPFFQQLAEQQQQSQHQHQQNAQQQQLIQNLFRNAAAASQANQQNPFVLPMQFPIQGVPPPFPSQDSSSSVPIFGQQSDSGYFNNFNNSQQQPQITISNSIYEEIDLCQDDSKDGSDIPGSLLHRERDRAGRSKRSRSRDRHDAGRRGGRRSRSRSRSRGRNKRGYRSRSRDRARENREREKERHKKGLPPMKKEHLSVCSTTLWVGHLSKLVSQEEISDTFGKLGDIISIDLISPRGCAFIVMNRRQDAMRALDKLGNTKLQGKTITLAWAPGKGVKGKEWKDYWEVVDGVSYIPWNRMRDDTNLEELEDGGCIDEDTLPDFLKNKPLPPADKSMEQQALMPPLPLDNENSQDSNSLVQPPLPPPNTSGGPPLPPGAGQIPGLAGLGGPPHHSGIPSLLDPSALAAAVGKAGDTDVRNDHPPMPPNPFGMGPPGLGMMPMGMNLMVPPPMLAMGGHFQGMGNIPGLPPMIGMGMVPAPQMSVSSGGPSAAPGHHPALGAPGLLGEMPLPTAAGVPASQQQLNDSLLHNINEESVLSSSEVNNEEGGGGRRGKKRSRFDDPEEKMSPPGETSAETGNMSPSQLKDDRPVFERLKSLADGYSFGGDKPGGNSLLGTPPNLGHRPLIPNAFGQSPSLLGSRPVRPPSLFATAAGSQQPSAWGGFGDTSENPFLNPSPNNPFAAAASAGNPFVPANFGTSENPFDITANSQGNPFAPQTERGGFGGRRGGWGRDGEWGGRGNRGGRGRGNWRGGRGGGGGWGNDQHIDDLMETDVESRGGFRGGRGGRGGRNDNPWNSRSDKPGDRRSGERDRPRSREGDRGSSRGRRSRSPSSQRRDKNDRGSRRRRSSNDNSSDRRSRHRSRSGDDHHRSDRSWKQKEHSDPPNQPSDENWEAETTDNEPGQPTQENVQNSECWNEGENDMSLDNNQLQEGGYKGGDQELTASHDQSTDQWVGENDDGPPGEDTYPHQEEEQIKEDPHRNQYEQECIPQEEMETEEDYPTQEETQYQDEEEEADHCVDEGKTDTDGCGYTNNEEAFDHDGDNHAKFSDHEGDNEVDYGQRKSEFENNEGENYDGEACFSGDGECETVYDNGEDRNDESYEQSNSHRDDDYSNYNNENEEVTDFENNGGNNSNNGEESRDYQNDCSAEAEPVPFSFGNTEEGNSEDGVGKCTSFVNSSSSKPVEEMNPISS